MSNLNTPTSLTTAADPTHLHSMQPLQHLPHHSRPQKLRRHILVNMPPILVKLLRRALRDESIPAEPRVRTNRHHIQREALEAPVKPVQHTERLVLGRI